MKLFILIAALTTVATQDENIFTKDFHPAASDMEKTLEYILQQGEQRYDPTNKFDNTAINLTPELVKDIAEVNNKIARRNCSGLEPVGTSCGLTYNPIVCGEHLPTLPYYKTDKTDENNATIYMTDKPENKTGNKYILVHRDFDWKINGISCVGKDSFNTY